MELHRKKCRPCEGGLAPLSPAKEEELAARLENWTLAREGNHRIRKVFQFSSFPGAIDFVNRVAEVAEAEGHHPDLTIHYGKVTVELTTHAVAGLT